MIKTIECEDTVNKYKWENPREINTKEMYQKMYEEAHQIMGMDRDS